MPLTPKGKKIMKSMKKQYGAKKGETVFYASKNKGAIKGVDKKRKNNVELDKKFIYAKRAKRSSFSFI